jgi:hypothetical protein
VSCVRLASMVEGAGQIGYTTGLASSGDARHPGHTLPARMVRNYRLRGHLLGAVYGMHIAATAWRCGSRCLVCARRTTVCPRYKQPCSNPTPRRHLLRACLTPTPVFSLFRLPFWLARACGRLCWRDAGLAACQTNPSPSNPLLASQQTTHEDDIHEFRQPSHMYD